MRDADSLMEELADRKSSFKGGWETESSCWPSCTALRSKRKDSSEETCDPLLAGLRSGPQNHKSNSQGEKSCNREEVS